MSTINAAPPTEINEASIGLLVDRFYAAIRRDPVLADVFEAAIPDDKWGEHLGKMRSFWSSVMLASGRYSGNPVSVHRGVAGLERSMFEHWLALFETTAAELFPPAQAALFVDKAHRIAGSLQIAVFHRLGGPPDGLMTPAGNRGDSRCD